MEEDWKKYWRRNQKKEHHILSNVFAISLVILIMVAFINKKDSNLFFDKDPGSLSVLDSNYVTLVDTTHNQLRTIMDSCKYGTQKFSIDVSSFVEYDDLLNNIDKIIEHETTKTLNTLKLNTTEHMRNLKTILESKILTYENYILLVDSYNNHITDFMNIFENELKDNAKKYIRTDDNIQYYYRVNP